MVEGLRERKKAQTRKAIAQIAKALFEARGFNNVTVAEIAAAADVSPKTVFTYFSSKEDLVFDGEMQLCDKIVARIRARKAGESALDAVRKLITDLLSEGNEAEVVAGFSGFAHVVAGAPTVAARLRLMWERYEAAVAAQLAAEAGSDERDPTPRMVAAQIVAIFRLIGLPDTRAYIQAFPVKHRRAAIDAWFVRVFGVLNAGIGDYARRDG